MPTMIGQPARKKGRPIGDDDLSQEQTGNYTPEDLARDGGNPFNLDNPRILEIAPPQPKSLEETGLKMGLLSDIGLKYLYYAGSATGFEVAQEVCLPWTGVIEHVIDFLTPVCPSTLRPRLCMRESLVEGCYTQPSSRAPA